MRMCACVYVYLYVRVCVRTCVRFRVRALACVKQLIFSFVFPSVQMFNGINSYSKP